MRINNHNATAAPFVNWISPEVLGSLPGFLNKMTIEVIRILRGYIQFQFLKESICRRVQMIKAQFSYKIITKFVALICGTVIENKVKL